MKDVLPGLVDLLSAVALGVLTLLAARAKRYLDRKGEDGLFSQLAFQVSEAVFDSVKKIAQVYTDDLKIKAADGKLTPAERKEARDSALKEAKKLLGPKLLSRIAEIFGLGSPAAIDDFLIAKIEAAVGINNERKALLGAQMLGAIIPRSVQATLEETTTPLEIPKLADVSV